MSHEYETTRSEQKTEVFKQFLLGLKSLGTCKREQCACIVCDSQLTRVFSIGYNGPPADIDNDACTEEPKQCGCVHAEANALIKLGHIREAYMYCTTAPCIHCAGLIINSKKIKFVYWIHTYTDGRGLMALQKAGILHDQLR